MTTNSKPKVQVTFAPGCFNNFTGTQEELDALVKTIMEMAESGKLLEESVPVEFDGELYDDEFDETLTTEIKPTTLH